MLSRALTTCAALAAAILLPTGAALAEPVTYTFDELPLNTPVTTQYRGVTFAVRGQSCNNNPTLFMRIRTPNGGTSSGTHALGIDTGCPDFSSDYFQMTFDLPQSEVSFTVGDFASTFTIRAYNALSGGTLLSSQTVVLDGTAFVGVHRVVRVTSAGENIRRIEVQCGLSLFEWIDDLTFEVDRTPPIAELTSPGPADCACSPVRLVGTVNDPDGTYLGDRAEFRAVNDPAWTLIGQASSPVIDGLLYTWNTTGLSEGLYYIRLTVDNAVGLSSSQTQVVWVSRDFDTVGYSAPAIVAGTAVPDGTVFDNYCHDIVYRVEYAPTGSVSFLPVDPGTPLYTGSRVNLSLATWDTTGVADGDYTLRVTGENDCGETRVTTRAIEVDNTAPIAFISSPSSCSLLANGSITIVGTVSDRNLSSWVLQYTGGDAHGWVTIASGTDPVPNRRMATWNTSGLRPCDYTLRLIAEDNAVRNNNGAIHNRTEFTVSVAVGCPGDYNRDGVLNSQDFFDYLTAFFAGC